MIPRMTFPRLRSAPRWARGAAQRTGLAAVFALGACSSDVLTVDDPDIIDPENVQSPAGAEAVRRGALGRLNNATSGGSATADNIFLLGGLFADEWINGDSFIARQEVDQRVITPDNSFVLNTNRNLHRARVSAEQAVELLTTYRPDAPRWQVAEMYFVQAYVENILAEHFCSGLVFSTVVDGHEQFGSPITTTAAFERALGHANDGLALITGNTADDLRVRHALQVTRGRILMNLNRPAEAATAVSGVPTSFRYQMLHTQQLESANNTYLRNVSERRYSVATNEGVNGLNFGTAGDPRLPVCEGNDTACKTIGVTNPGRDDQGRPIRVQMLWTVREAPVTIVSGVEARLIEAEAQLRAGAGATSLATLNALRTTVTGLAPLADTGTAAGNVSQLFRERAFWLFGRGHRTGDMRRLVRQYGRAANTVFPVGAYHKNEATYGVDVNMPIPKAEQNNPNAPGDICIDRNA